LTYKPQSKTKMYKGYEVLHKADIEDNLDSMLTILHRAKEEMIKPLMFHFVVGITNPDDVSSKLTQAIKEKFTSEINKNHKDRKANEARKRKTPKLELFYSIRLSALFINILSSLLPKTLCPASTINIIWIWLYNSPESFFLVSIE